MAPIELSFDGERIGANGIDGPFLIRNLLVNGAGGSLLLQMVAETSPFQAREFEGFVENKPPVAQCQNVTVPTDLGLCTANASVDAGSFDPEGSPITLKQTPPGPYGPGLTNVTLTVTDNQQSSDACTATVTVVASASCEEPELLNNELSAKVKPGTSVYNPTPVPDGPAGTFSFTAEFCNIGTKQLTTLKSVTTTLTAGHVLLNRDSGTPPAVGSEVTFSANGGYSDLNLGPNECVDVHYQIGLAVQASFEFFVDVVGVASTPRPLKGGQLAGPRRERSSRSIRLIQNRDRRYIEQLMK